MRPEARSAWLPPGVLVLKLLETTNVLLLFRPKLLNLILSHWLWQISLTRGVLAATCDKDHRQQCKRQRYCLKASQGSPALKNESYHPASPDHMERPGT